MIPKKLHYCWFGYNKKSQLILDCIASWEKYLPDYEIIEWNESNFDIDQSRYCQEMYRSKRWAFVSDYARAKILYDHGGLYLDTDMLLLKPMDDISNHPFVGLQNRPQEAVCVAGGIINLPPQHEYMNFVLKQLNLAEKEIIIVDPLTNFFSKNIKNLKHLSGSREIHGINVYDRSFFYPFYHDEPFRTENNSYSVHLWNASYLTKREVVRRDIISSLQKHFWGRRILNTAIFLRRLLRKHLEFSGKSY